MFHIASSISRPNVAFLLSLNALIAITYVLAGCGPSAVGFDNRGRCEETWLLCGVS